MAEIKEVFNDIKDTVGDKGFLILIAAAAAVFIYNLTKQESPSDEALTTVTHVASYPDAVTNANVIIDKRQSNTEITNKATNKPGTLVEFFSIFSPHPFILNCIK